MIDKVNYSPSDLKVIFDKNPDVELLLDLAHIDDYEHLQKLINVKYPTCLHIADKRFKVEHEHLPIGEGQLDFEIIFKKYLKSFCGKIILEVVDTDDAVIHSLKKIKDFLKK